MKKKTRRQRQAVAVAAAAMVEEEVRWLPWKGQRLREREKRELTGKEIRKK